MAALIHVNMEMHMVFSYAVPLNVCGVPTTGCLEEVHNAVACSYFKSVKKTEP